MKTLLTALACTALATGAITTSIIGATEAQASGPFDKLKKKVKKAKDKVDQAERAVDSVTGGTAVSGGSMGSVGGSGGSGPAGNAGATPAKYANMTKCANLNVGNAFVGRDGNYTFQQGLSTEKRSGLLNRRDITPVNGCLYEGLGVDDVLYVEFDAKKYKRYDYEIQCASFDGSEQLDHAMGPKLNNYNGKDVMLHEGNSTGYTPTATGSNSARGSAYSKYMAKRGRTFITLSFHASHTDRTGTDFYCQLYNKNTGESAVALTYRRGPTGT